MSDVLFREEQKLVPGAGGKLLFLVPLVVVGLFLMVHVIGIPAGSPSAIDLPSILLAVVGIGLPLLLGTARLVTEVRADGVHCRFVPFHRVFRPFPIDQIRSHEVRTFKALREYGGWGLRCGPAGRAYTVRGNRGVQLHLGDGKRLMVGSQQPEELARALEQIRDG